MKNNPGILYALLCVSNSSGAYIVILSKKIFLNRVALYLASVGPPLEGLQKETQALEAQRKEVLALEALASEGPRKEVLALE